MIAVFKPRSNYAKVDVIKPHEALQWVEMFPNNRFVYVDYNHEKLHSRYGVHNFPDIDYLSLPDLYKVETFSEMAQILDKFIEDYNITECVQVYTEFMDPFTNGLEEKAVKTINKFIETDKVTTFSSVAKKHRDAFIIYYLGSKVTTHHIVIDPKESKWTEIVDKGGLRLTSYDMPEDHGVAFPYLQYHNFKNLQTPHKTSRFVFGLNVYPEREYLYESLMNVKHPDVNILVKYKKEGIDTLVKKDVYDQMVRDSEFTLMIKSISGKHFSSGRFWESLVKGCIPIALDDSNWEDELKYYPQLFDVYRDNLVTSIDNLAPFIDSLDYKHILQLIQNTDDWKNLQSKDWYIEKASVLQFADTDAPIKQVRNVLF